MVRGKALSEDLRKSIIDAHDKGKSYKKIAVDFNLAKSTVQYIVNTFKETKSLKIKSKTGGPRKTTSADDRQLRRIIRKNPHATTVEIKGEWEKVTQCEVSTMTCNRRIKELGYGFYKVSYLHFYFSVFRN